MRALIVLGLLLAATSIAHGEPDPKRKVSVLEYRAGSSGLPGIAARVAAAVSKQTSLQVIGPDQTRAMFGDGLEQSLVSCQGEPDCVAKIGAKVGAAEVILVGVSELGDVILTMQRISVPGRSIEGRVADSIAPGAQPSDSQLDSYLTKLLLPTDFMRFGVIDIIANEVGAEVTVGGEKRGITPIQPLKLRAPATYEIKVEKYGFVPFTAQVAVPADGEYRVRAQLQRPGADKAWYTRWYVLTAAGLLVAGAAGTTIYFATAESSDRVTFNGSVR